MTEDARFYEIAPSDENYWRAIVLFGRNVASYKFALAKALYDLKDGSELITLERLAPIYARHISEHLKGCDKQITSAQSRFLDSCRGFNSGNISQSKLNDVTVKLGFNNVIDAFHNVHGAELGLRFFVDERKINGGIRLTDNFYKLAEKSAFHDLNIETEARWRLVETAWDLSLPKQVVQIAHDETTNLLHALSSQKRRVDITPARNALNGYQKGLCFYCYRKISINPISENLADVDHFFPHKLQFCADGKPINGVSNLVLACKECNRGASGKFDRIPKLPFLERLSQRNEYLIKSHHPLRETLMLQTGLIETERRSYLQDIYNCAKSHVIVDWEPKACGEAIF